MAGGWELGRCFQVQAQSEKMSKFWRSNAEPSHYSHYSQQDCTINCKLAKRLDPNCSHPKKEMIIMCMIEVSANASMVVVILQCINTWNQYMVHLVCWCVFVCARSCLTLWNPMNCSPPDFSGHGIPQARILEAVAVPSSRGSSRPRDWTPSLTSPALAGGFFTTNTSWETLVHLKLTRCHMSIISRFLKIPIKCNRMKQWLVTRGLFTLQKN